MSARSRPLRGSRLLLLAPAAALVLVALCLRAPFTAVGPLVDAIGSEYELSPTALAALTALPLVCFAALSPLGPVLARRVGLHGGVVAATVVIALGVVLRLTGPAGLFAGTVVLAGGIAVVNVLLPAVVRAEYGRRSAAVLGITTGAIALSASLGAGLAQPSFGLAGSARGGLALFAVPVLVAAGALAVLVLARRGGRAAPLPERRPGLIFRDPVARFVALFFGLQALSFYAMLTWLPSVLIEDAGLSPTASGALVAIGAALGGPAALVVPGLAARSPGQERWVIGISVPTGAAILGLLLAPAAAPALWALLYGLGTALAFPLAMVLMLLRSRDVAATGRLSAASQSAGYLIAAAGPLGIGLLRDATGGWTVALWVLLAALVAQTAVGLGAARPRLVVEREAVPTRR
jgi:MFS transporter, CP family, cyanate transporter